MAAADHAGGAAREGLATRRAVGGTGADGHIVESAGGLKGAGFMPRLDTAAVKQPD
jgi:hypothetical protein